LNGLVGEVVGLAEGLGGGNHRGFLSVGALGLLDEAVQEAADGQDREEDKQQLGDACRAGCDAAEPEQAAISAMTKKTTA
jgi:hypothetical protein